MILYQLSLGMFPFRISSGLYLHYTIYSSDNNSYLAAVRKSIWGEWYRNDIIRSNARLTWPRYLVHSRHRSFLFLAPTDQHGSANFSFPPVVCWVLISSIVHEISRPPLQELHGLKDLLVQYFAIVWISRFVQAIEVWIWIANWRSFGSCQNFNFIAFIR